MKTIFYTTDLELSGRFAATVGFFDGVHRGHQFLIERLQAAARERGLQSMVISFEQHPCQVVRPEHSPRLLTTLDEKIHLIAQTGVDVLVVLRFDAAMAALPARPFMQRVLQRQLGVMTLLMGYDNRFGSRARSSAESFEDYVRYGRETGLEVLCGDPLCEDSTYFSSSFVRDLIAEGRVDAAARGLGRLYALSGTVVAGKRLGRRLGFPTANLHIDDSRRLIPASGVYAVRVCLADDAHEYVGVMNIGTCPTFGGERQTLEVHILDFSGDLYGRNLTVRFLDRLRDECHFASPEALVHQMERDITEARKRFQAQEL